MKLALHYQKQAIQTANAFLIQGDSLEYWLEQLTIYEIDLQDVFCYVLPTSISEPTSSGLFVVLKEEKPAKLFSFAYQKIGDKLFIPTNASIFPMLSEIELNQLLLWDVQVFHPSIGLVGFEKGQTYDFEEALVFLPNQTALWSFAQEGIKPPMDLLEIRVEQKPEEEQLDNLKDFVEKEIGGKKPIEELKEEKKEEGFLQDLKEKTKEKLLKGTQNILNSWKEKLQENQKLINSNNQYVNQQNYSESDLSKILSAIFGMLAFIPSATSVLGDYNKSNTYEEKQSLLEKLDNWVNQQIDDIEAKRNNEINRLLDLFDKNSDEALQYALPLNSPYADRGEIAEQERSVALSKNDTDFRLGGLKGGGKSSDAWDLKNEHYQQLRQKYENAANQAIEKKDFRKAAYIYAHLLGDFQKAANVLEQGKFYHEAVAIYKKHLNNLKAAAQCYERGGMLLEAIDIYKELEKEEEKIGDLYTVLNQYKNAKVYYDKCVSQAISKRDYREAYRLQKNKLKDRSESKEILLKAWEVKAQEEYCLREYFLLEIEDNQEEVPEIVETFYKGLEDREKITYLKVLDNVLKKHKEEAFVLSTQKIAYEIVSEEILKNNINHFPLFQKFIPNDPLLFTDFSRFIKNFKPNIPKKEESYQEVFELPADFSKEIFHVSTEWIEAIHQEQNFLVIGKEDGKAIVVRSNLHGDTEYLIFDVEHVVGLLGTPNIVVQSQFNLSNAIFLLRTTYFSNQQFSRNDKFSSAINFKSLEKSIVDTNSIFRIITLLHQNQMCIAVFNFNLGKQYSDESIILSYYHSETWDLIESKTYSSYHYLFDENSYNYLSNIENINDDSYSEEVFQNDLLVDINIFFIGKAFVSLLSEFEILVIPQSPQSDENSFLAVEFSKEIIQLVPYSDKDILIIQEQTIIYIKEKVIHSLCHEIVAGDSSGKKRKLVNQTIYKLDETEFIQKVQKMTNDELVLLVKEDEKQKVIVLEMIEDKAHEKHMIELKNPIVDILPTNEQGKYYFLEPSGKVVFYKV